MEKEIRVLSQTAAHTGVYHRLKFNREMERKLARSMRYESSCSVVLFDMDHSLPVRRSWAYGA